MQAVRTVFAAALALGLFASTSAVRAQDVIKVGAPLPLTGALSPEGLKQQRGYNLWAETANAAGGIKVGGKPYKVEIVYVDYASNTPRAVQVAERLITEDKANFLFAPFGSGAAKAASGVSERYGIPTIAATASSREVYDQGYKFLFGTFTPNETLIDPLTEIVSKGDPAVKRVAILARNDLLTLSLANLMQAAAKAKGLEVVMMERYAIGTMDHASAITQMRGAKPDWVFATGYINDLILIRKQMADQGVSPKVLTMIAGPAYKEFTEATGPLAENVSSASWWHPAVRYKGVDLFGTTEAFNAAFEKKYNVVPDYAEASAAAAGAILQLAIEKAGTLDPAKVRDALAAMDLVTFYGPVKFGPTGQITSLEPPVFQIQGGKPVVVFPAAVKQADFIFGK
ncbi:amino acid ABC transporter substrate-binding protein [Aquabacter spiritensis]|uniref:Amino acid/amide ABC transporter substrate-binding protein (HAAT family) n=1 Tax=Aquabacter spiritensis TaxID=933073 RepID=A0A4R3LUK6_9HYPH|nr:amino acid ABC transporter substrate-binding protein [Aquabacter spiritensis]TCT04191.1 amino acid/amide ABC transporter substrate-binding protein (HAAT family) [Aquabacter spiritensis]